MFSHHFLEILFILSPWSLTVLFTLQVVGPESSGLVSGLYVLLCWPISLLLYLHHTFSLALWILKTSIVMYLGLIFYQDSLWLFGCFFMNFWLSFLLMRNKWDLCFSRDCFEFVNNLASMDILIFTLLSMRTGHFPLNL